MYGFGGEAAPAEVKAWQARAGLEAGRCAETLLAAAKSKPTTDQDKTEMERLVKLARQGFQYVIEQHPGSECVGPAETRLRDLSGQ
jgi:hypothetical protein